MKVFVAYHGRSYEGITKLIGVYTTNELALEKIYLDKINGNPKECKHNHSCWWDVEELELEGARF